MTPVPPRLKSTLRGCAAAVTLLALAGCAAYPAGAYGYYDNGWPNYAASYPYGGPYDAGTFGFYDGGSWPFAGPWWYGHHDFARWHHFAGGPGPHWGGFHHPFGGGPHGFGHGGMIAHGGGHGGFHHG